MDILDRSKFNNNEVDFLMRISRIMLEQKEPKVIVEMLDEAFSVFFSSSKMVLSVWDEPSSRLRDFEKDWVAYPDEAYDKKLLGIFKILRQQKGKFFFNDALVDLKIALEDYEKVCASISETENTIYFPLLEKDRVFGVIELSFAKLDEIKVFNTNFLSVLYLAFMHISSVLLNYILREQMQISLNFYQAMKDIAKIIESQYELTYIIPLIGEMIDRFISAHLIYIFILNKEGRYELLWPGACKDKEIMMLLQQINIQTDYIISQDNRIGVFPLISENTILGAIVAYSTTDILAKKEIEYLSQLGKQSSTTIQRANVYAEVLKHATLDALTGLNNRRQFETRLNQEISTTKRKGTPLCAIMLDVDYFKKVNDTYGHAAGDCVLKGISTIITREIREYDIAARYGGEEFFILLPQTSLEEAHFVAQRLRKAVEEADIDISAAKVNGFSSLNVTISLGVSAYNPEETAEEFYHNTDKALYEAKEHGRNKVVVFEKAVSQEL